MKLIVIHDFGGHIKGDEITDAKEVEAILASEFAPCVQKVAVPAEKPAKK